MSGTTQATRHTVETLYRCGKRGDMIGALATLDRNLVIHEPSFLPYAGMHHGVDGFLHLLGVITQSHMDFSRMEVERLVVEGEYCFALVRVPALRGGMAVFAEEFRVRDGRITQIRLHFHDTASIPVDGHPR